MKLATWSFIEGDYLSKEEIVKLSKNNEDFSKGDYKFYSYSWIKKIKLSDGKEIKVYFILPPVHKSTYDNTYSYMVEVGFYDNDLANLSIAEKRELIKLLKRIYEDSYQKVSVGNLVIYIETEFTKTSKEMFLTNDGQIISPNREKISNKDIYNNSKPGLEKLNTLKSTERNYAINILQAYSDGAKSRNEIAKKINIAESYIRDLEEKIKAHYRVDTKEQMLMLAAKDNLINLPQN